MNKYNKEKILIKIKFNPNYVSDFVKCQQTKCSKCKKYCQARLFKFQLYTDDNRLIQKYKYTESMKIKDKKKTYIIHINQRKDSAAALIFS